MKKRICKITALLLAASLFASGCGGKDGDGGRTEPETGALESTAAESLKNGSRVSMQLTDKVKLEAEAALPEDWDGTAETCQVQLKPFDAKTLAPRLFPQIKEEQWGHYYGEDSCDYGDEKINILIDTEISYYTLDWWAQEAYLPMRTVNRDIICGPDEYTEELSFASRADIQAKAVDWVVNKAGIENVRVDRIYSVRGEDVLEEYNKNVASGGNDIGKPVDDPENPEEIFKDCYWLHMSRYVNGLPLLGGSYSRQDEAYIPDGRIYMAYTGDGMEQALILWDYEILGKEGVSLADMETVYGALKRKYELNITGEMVLDQMGLIYFPYPVDTEQYIYDLVPVWEFSGVRDGLMEKVYINAVDGKEIVL